MQVPESESREQQEQGSESVSPFPSGIIAFGIAALAAVAFVVDGYFAIHRGRQGCDGGTCVMAFYVGIAKGLAALVVGFPTLWILISLFRRLLRPFARSQR